MIVDIIEAMRQGDFSEVLAFNPNFRIHDPATGNTTTGADRAVTHDAAPRS